MKFCHALLIITFASLGLVFGVDVELKAVMNGVDYNDLKKKEGHGHGHHHHDHHHHSHHGHHHSSFKPVKLYVDQGLAHFTFNAAGEWAEQAFYFYSSKSTNLQVFDCFCGGDQFRVYDNGKIVADANAGCTLASSDCNYYSRDPKTCLTQEGWCSFPGIALLEPGTHNITIKTLVSFYGGGSGFVGLYSACQDGPCCDYPFNCPTNVYY